LSHEDSRKGERAVKIYERILNVATRQWQVGVIEDHQARPLTDEELDAAIRKLNAPPASAGTRADDGPEPGSPIGRARCPNIMALIASAGTEGPGLREALEEIRDSVTVSVAKLVDIATAALARVDDKEGEKQ
jgi:hypothetical protein